MKVPGPTTRRQEAGGSRQARKDRFLLPASCLLLSGLSAFCAGCGYHVGGKGALLPPNIKTIAIPAFKNETPRFKVEQVITRAVVREFLARSRFRIQPQAEGSDAVLSGVITQFWTTPVVAEPTAGRTVSLSVNVRMRVKMTDNHTGKILFENPDFIFSDTYEISGNAATYFEESAPALERLSRAFAASLVSSVLEAF
jgi:hypothetical protein